MDGLFAAPSLLAVSDTVWLALIAGAGPIVLAYLQLRTAREVKDAKAKLESLSKVAEVTHSLVNSGMGSQLLLHARTARALANQTGDKGDITVAETAEKMSAEHVAKQEIADRITQEAP